MFETIIRDKSNHWVLSNCLRSFYFYTYSPILTSLRQTLQKLIEMVEFGVKDGCFYHGHSVVGSMISNKLKLKTSGTIQCFFFNQSGSFSNNVDQQKCRELSRGETLTQNTMYYIQYIVEKLALFIVRIWRVWVYLYHSYNRGEWLCSLSDSFVMCVCSRDRPSQ